MTESVGSATAAPRTSALATAVRDAVLGVPGVARMTSGATVQVATHFPGGMIIGVRLGWPDRDDPVEVRVAVDEFPIGPVADRVHAAVRAVLAGMGTDRRVEVVVDDVDLPSGAGRDADIGPSSSGARR